MTSTVLVTGAAGFIGSHFARVAHDAGLRVIALDNLSTSKTWPDLPETIERVDWEIQNRVLMRSVIKELNVDSIVHFAGRICVGESMKDPGLYFEENVSNTITLLDEAIRARDGKPLSFVMSSSAAVYGQPSSSDSRIAEYKKCSPINPYGASKLAAELVLEAYMQSVGVRGAMLRYFNAAGAHPDGTLAERHDPETHLIPLAIDAARGIRPPLVVHGADYDTGDGTCVRDYVHVMDLAEAHLAALTALETKHVGAVNLGSESGASVHAVLTEVSQAVGRPVPYETGPRRMGDPSRLVAHAEFAQHLLGWKATRGLGQIVEDAARSRQ